MEVLKIIWIDSCASNMTWTLMDELDGDIEPIKIISYGVLIQETEECVTIAQNYGENPNQCCSLMTIPKGCIKEKKSNRRIVIKSNMMKLYIARNEDGSLALFRKKKPKLFWDEKVGQYWAGSSIWLDSNDYPEVTFENSPMEVELKFIEK